MKKKQKLFRNSSITAGIGTLFVIFIMSLILAGCDFDVYKPDVLTGEVTITGGSNPPSVGDTLTAVYAGGNGTGTASWQWFRGDAVISGATRNTYTVTASDVGRTIKVRVSYADKSGTATSKATAAVVAASFVAVTNITGVPTTGTVGTVNLTGTVAPSNATNKTITWSVKTQGTTGAAISGNTLTITAAGSVVVTATIANGTAQGTNYTKDFTITISASSGFVPVTNITGVPTTGTVGTINLSGTVAPSTATNMAVTWAVQDAGTTGAVISGNTLTTTAAGTVVVTATIANGTAQGTAYTKDFSITITASSFVPVTNITGGPTSGTSTMPLTLSGTVVPANATNKTIEWSVANTQSVTIIKSGTTITPTITGQPPSPSVVVTATIANGTAVGTNYTQKFTIPIAAFVAVAGITGVPNSGTAGTPLTLPTLPSAVQPANATNKTITWSVVRNDNSTAAGAALNGNTLTTAKMGVVTVTATIANGRGYGMPYTQPFDIQIVNFVPVNNVIGVPATWTTGDQPINLSLNPGLGVTIIPSDATNQTITWSFTTPTTGVSVSLTNNSTLTITSTAVGMVGVIATIANGKANGADFVKEFSIKVNPPP